MVSLCPVCKGRGMMPSGFYKKNSTSENEVQCKSCYGRGVIIEQEQVPYIPYIPYVTPTRPWWNEPPMIPYSVTNGTVDDPRLRDLRVYG